MQKAKIILGSQSPRRKEILSFFSLDIHQVSPPFDESTIPFLGDPVVYVQEIAKHKALSLRAQHPNIPILTADTIVIQEGKLFLKPVDEQEAKAMLQQLSGKHHFVYSGVCISWDKRTLTDWEETKVLFHHLTSGQIDAYCQSFNLLDKSGAYAIQKGGSIVVKRIDGCYYNVMGLPLNPVCRLLGKIGINLWDHLST